MYARQVDQRSAVFQKAVEVGDAYILKTKVDESSLLIPAMWMCMSILFFMEMQQY